MSFYYFIFLLSISASALIGFSFFGTRARNGKRPLYEKKSTYHHIAVYEEDFIRTLRLGKGFDAGKQSGMDIRYPDHLILEYTRLVFAGLLINDSPERILIIGLGGGVIPRAFNRHFPEAEIDVVELDSQVLKVAERYFQFETGKKIRVFISDGRVFVEKKISANPPVKYDMIVLDAFDSNSIPGHLLTKEFLEMIQRIMEPKGVIVANVLSDSMLFHSIIRTYRKVFGRCYVFLGEQARNAILVTPGTGAPGLLQKELMEKAYRLNKNFDFNFSMFQVARQIRWGFGRRKLSKILKD